MTKKDQRRILSELLKTIRKSLLEKSSKWPKEWDGNQIRALVEREATALNSGTCATKRMHFLGRVSVKRHRKARKDFEADCYAANL